MKKLILFILVFITTACGGEGQDVNLEHNSEADVAKEATTIPVEEPSQNATVVIVQREDGQRLEFVEGFVESETLLEAQGVPTAAWGELQEPPTVPWAYISPPQHGQDGTSQENLALLYGVWDATRDSYNFLMFHPNGLLVGSGGMFLYTVSGNSIALEPVDNNSSESFTYDEISVSQDNLTLGDQTFTKHANVPDIIAPERYSEAIIGEWASLGEDEIWTFRDDGTLLFMIKDSQGQVTDSDEAIYRVSGEGIFIDEEHYLAVMIAGDVLIIRDIDDPTYDFFQSVD